MSGNVRIPEQQALVPLRTAVILVLAAVIGALAGVLTFWADGEVPAAAMTGLTAFVGVLLPLDKLIGR